MILSFVFSDTAYMYILGMLIMLKIYQTRHPDVNASAHSAYMVMAVVIFLGVLGVVSFISGHYCNIFFTEMVHGIRQYKYQLVTRTDKK